MSFTFHTKVRFADVDPAGIVFYPRYFEMLNAAVEDWFEAGLGVSFAELHLDRMIGVPTVKLDTTFLSPSRLGDVLEVRISVKDVGQSSCSIDYLVTGNDGVERLNAAGVLVCMNLRDHRAMPWPEDIRAGLGPVHQSA